MMARAWSLGNTDQMKLKVNSYIYSVNLRIHQPYKRISDIFFHMDFSTDLYTLKVSES